MGRLMALDFGSKTVGVALSDELYITANGLEVIRRQDPDNVKATIERIVDIIKEYNVEKIVLGYPLNMDDSRGESAKRVERFKEKLSKVTNLDIILWDERLTTVESHNLMREAGMNWKKRNKVVDKVAAVLILESYMSSNNLQKPLF